MADKVTIYNMALLSIGATTVTSTSDNVVGVRHLDVFYETTRDRLLSEFPWNFAIEQAALTQLAAVPLSGYDYAYQLPTDCLNVLCLSEDEEYRITTGGVLECDYDAATNGTIYVEYVKRIEDESLFSPGFVKCLSLALAIEIAMPMRSSMNMRDELTQLYGMALQRAQASDWKQDKETPSYSNVDNNAWISELS